MSLIAHDKDIAGNCSPVTVAVPLTSMIADIHAVACLNRNSTKGRGGLGEGGASAKDGET